MFVCPFPHNDYSILKVDAHVGQFIRIYTRTMSLHKHKMMLQSHGVLAGRFLLALLFVSSGINMLLGGVGNTAMYFDSMGVPVAGVAAMLVIALKISAGVAMMVGYKVEEAASALFVFTALTILIAHRDTADLNLWKNLAIMGGLLYAMAYGAGDGWKLKTRSGSDSSLSSTPQM